MGNYPKIGPDTKGPNLRAAISRHQLGRITEDELDQTWDEVTREVLTEQAQAGIDLVTDGHIRWDDPQTYFASRISGFQIDGLIRYLDTNTYFRQPVSEGELRWQGPITVDDYRFAAANCARPVKAVVTGPYTLAKLSRCPHYRALGDAVMALARVLNQEARALAAAGAPVVQFDEPAILRNKGDFPLLKEATSALVEGVTATTALYACFGDISGIARDFLSLPFDIIGLDFVMGPANFELVAALPEGKRLGLGIVDARNTKMESADEIVAQIGRVSPYVSLDLIHVSPSCGLEFLPRPNAYRKLVRMVEGVAKAREVLS